MKHREAIRANDTQTTVSPLQPRPLTCNRDCLQSWENLATIFCVFARYFIVCVYIKVMICGVVVLLKIKSEVTHLVENVMEEFGYSSVFNGHKIITAKPYLLNYFRGFYFFNRL
jgi:hypothetical protein